MTCPSGYSPESSLPFASRRPNSTMPASKSAGPRIKRFLRCRPRGVMPGAARQTHVRAVAGQVPAPRRRCRFAREGCAGRGGARSTGTASQPAGAAAHTAAMTPGLASALMPLLRGMDAEAAHGLALRALGLGLAGRDAAADDPVLATEAFGLRFRNPVGLAAGFDKDAAAVLPLLRLGFGFVEAGTVTPKPQPGNPRPRLFRLPEDRAVINRMGFNNGGLDAFRTRLAALPRPLPGVVGANIGVNKEGALPERDYPALDSALAPFADYVVVNVSSPNTPGLRDLQGEARLGAILDAIGAARGGLERAPPL